MNALYGVSAAPRRDGLFDVYRTGATGIFITLYNGALLRRSENTLPRAYYYYYYSIPESQPSVCADIYYTRYRRCCKRRMKRRRRRGSNDISKYRFLILRNFASYANSARTCLRFVPRLLETLNRFSLTVLALRWWRISIWVVSQRKRLKFHIKHYIIYIILYDKKYCSCGRDIVNNKSYSQIYLNRKVLKYEC